MIRTAFITQKELNHVPQADFLGLIPLALKQDYFRIADHPSTEPEPKTTIEVFNEARNAFRRRIRMKAVLAVAAMCLIPAVSISQQPREDLGLPELDLVKTATLSPSYGCRSDAEFKKGYQNTALFLSKYSRDHNSPELLFASGQCKSEDFFQMYDFDLIADLGEISIERLGKDQAFNTHAIPNPENYSRFAGYAKPVLHHTYALLINRGHMRGLLYFTIVAYEPNQKLELTYVVRDYELFNSRARATGKSLRPVEAAPK